MNDLNRRQFIVTTLAATAAAAAATLPLSARAADAPAASGEYLELRAYRLKDGAPHTLLDGYLEKALVPALNLAGVEAVGVFTEPEAKDGPAVWVLIPHPSLESVAKVAAAINEDPAVLAAGADYLNSPTKQNPAFDRIDSWIFLPFAGLPKLAVPALARDRKPRIFEMRTYESFSELKALKKIAMFNAGEIGVMQELNLSPVFYGQALVGRDLPHLTYMLCSPDLETHKRNWQQFTVHPTWIRLKSDPQYADTVQKITSRFLVPAAYSQI
jgi:NIPSNAP